MECYTQTYSSYNTKLKQISSAFVVDCPLTDSEGSQLLSNGEEKLAERMVKDSEPRKSIGGLKKNGIDNYRGCKCAADFV